MAMAKRLSKMKTERPTVEDACVSLRRPGTPWDNSGVERMLLSSEKCNVVTATRPVLSRTSFCGYT